MTRSLVDGICIVLGAEFKLAVGAMNVATRVLWR